MMNQDKCWLCGYCDSLTTEDEENNDIMSHCTAPDDFVCPIYNRLIIDIRNGSDY